MKILHVIISRNFAGSERLAVLLARQQSRAGHDVKITYRGRGNFEKFLETDMEVAKLAVKVRRHFFQLSMKKLFRTFQPEIVHYHLTTAVREAPSISKLITCKHVFHLHVHKNAPVYSVAAKMGSLIAISESTKEFYLNFVNIPSKKMSLVENAVDFQHTCLANEDKSSLKEGLLKELALPKESILLLLAGRVHADKGHLDLINALPELLESVPNVHLLIVGETSSKDGYLKSLKSLSKKLQVKEFVHFLGWRSDVPRLCRASDVQVVPSRVEPFGLVVLEAMALDTPVVTTGVEGISGIVIDNDNALLYESGDFSALAKKILMLINEPEVRERIIINAKKHLLEFYSSEKFYQKIMDVYSETDILACDQNLNSKS